MYDLIVIGGGSGGVAAARRAASYGAKTLLVEKSKLGGTCVNLGCVPKKLFVYASAYKQEFLSSKNYGWDIEIKNFDWLRLIKNKNDEIARLNDIYNKMLLKSSVEIVQGNAEFFDNNTIQVNQKKYQGKKILIATGSRYRKMEVPGRESVKYSDDLFFLKELPQEMVIVGGGYIAVEFASIFNELGVDTTLVIRGNRILKEFDHKAVDFLQEQMQQKGIKFLFEKKVVEIKNNSDKQLLILNSGEKLSTDMVVAAIGRVPNTENLGLSAAGVNIGKNNQIIADENLETSTPNIYAVGDVTGKSSLTPVAIRDGRAFADEKFANKKTKISYDKIATAIFTQPNFASIGMGEEQAIKSSKQMKVYTAQFRPMRNAMAGINDKAFLKILVNKKNDKVEGMHIISQDAGEIIQGFASAIQAGITKNQLDETMAIHPTMAEEFVTMYNKSYDI